ncbi:hypothetical protein TCAL_06181 [Tigriopus californicus]|uniref:Uncharacterized protein n=1 Tax=Tigriopus californicus TaxID=6832 RepID=A0A553PMA2_TIGCA|nr:hypothetical protein TCAL_06181 [Tigriopus californicus]
MNLLNLLAQGGTTNEEDLVINMFHSALNPTWFRVQRLGLINENSCCHVFNVGLDNLNHNTIATILKGHSMGRMVFDFEYYDHGDLLMMPNIRAGVLHSGIGDFYNVQIFPGQSLDLELRACENQRSSHVSWTLVLARAELIEPNELNRIEMCRLYRQLSRRCQEEDPRRKFLGEKYPNICSDVGDFYIKFQFKECLSNNYALERTHDVAQYIRDNLASITLNIDSIQ